MEEKKKYFIPEAEIITFDNDVITDSEEFWGGNTGEATGPQVP